MGSELYRVRAGRLTLPPICEEEFEPAESTQEADSETRRRRDAGLAAGREVRRSRAKAERAVVATFLDRLKELERELRGILAAAGTSDFRRFQTAALLAEVDAAIERSQTALVQIAAGGYRQASELGHQQVDQAVFAAKVGLSFASGINAELVDAAGNVTLDLLTEAMVPYRNRIRLQVRRIATTGASFGDEMASLARNLDRSGASQAAFKAERVLRTELSRTFSGSTFARMEDLAQRMPFIRKIWIRTADSRTRDTHAAAGAAYGRGRGIPIDERFSVGRATLRFPVDPLAEPAGPIAAKETILCRCATAVDFDVAELKASSARRLSLAFSSGGR